MTIPTVDTVDMTDPRQHVLPALIHLPASGGAATVTHPSILEEWSAQIHKAGYAYVPWLIEQFSCEGWIRVEDLPQPELKFVPPHRGPQSTLNPGGRWLPIEDEEPQRPVLPDLEAMTQEEVGAILSQAVEMGYVTRSAETTEKAEVLYD